jgi:hypothetical protein
MLDGCVYAHSRWFRHSICATRQVAVDCIGTGTGTVYLCYIWGI